MTDSTVEVLTKFHREVFLPDIERLVSRVVDEQELRMNRHFAEIHRRFDRLELAMRGAPRLPVVEP